MGEEAHPVNLTNTIPACFYIFKGEKFGGGGGALENKPHVPNKRISPDRVVLLRCYFLALL